MWRYILKRLLWVIPVTLGVAILIFTIMYFCPGDPASLILGSQATEQELQELRVSLGLTQPYYTRLFKFLRDVFLRVDLGSSYFTGKSIAAELVNRFPYTFTIAFFSMLLSITISVPLGITAAQNQGGIRDSLSMLIALLGISMPQFWLGLMLVLVFSVKLGWLPSFGVKGITSFILPCVANCFGVLAQLARQTRSAMLEVIRSDYIITAKAKGTPKRLITWKHALPNALIPVVTVAGTQFGRLLGGTVIIETVFSIPGIGTYMVNAIKNRDYPIIQGSIVFLAILFCLIMLIVDLLYAFIDPRIKSQYAGKSRRKEKANA